MGYFSDPNTPSGTVNQTPGEVKQEYNDAPARTNVEQTQSENKNSVSAPIYVETTFEHSAQSSTALGNGITYPYDTQKYLH